MPNFDDIFIKYQPPLLRYALKFIENEDDAINLALLRIGRRDEEPDIQAGNGETRRRPGKPGNHAPGKRIKSLRGGETKPVDET